MLLKRSIVLVAGILLFIAAFIIYFEVSRAQMERRFRVEREKFNVQGVNLTTPAASSDTNSAPATPSSTLNYPRTGTNRSPFFQLASYRPANGAEIAMAGAPTGTVTAPQAPPIATPAPAAVTNHEPTPPPATNAVPAAQSSVAAHPVTDEGKVIVLLYHQFRPAGVPIPAKYQWTLHQDVFAAEMKYIHDNGYHVISMSDLLKFLKHEISVPANSVCITVDDGYKSAIVYAAPILKQYGYPWTFFIYPEFITEGEGPGAASWNDLLELQKEGVDIESHSMTHPKLSSHHQLIKGVWHNLSPVEYDQWLANETAGSKALLEKKMGKTITCFAYPYGLYNKQVENAAISAGYEAIFTVAGNPVHSTTDLHSIGRYTITQEEVKNFASDLRQGALGLDAAYPTPGATISNPRPVITATLGYAGKLDPKSIETSVYDFDVRHDFDPQTNTIRLYLPRDLIQQVVLVNIRVKDAATGQVMVAKWHFNYEAAAAATIHTPLTSTTNAPASKTTAAPVATNAPAAAEPESLEKSAIGTPLDTHPAPQPAPQVSPH